MISGFNRVYINLMRSLAQSFTRAFYKVAFVGIRLYWFVFRPHTYSALIFIFLGEGQATNVLLVRHTYDNQDWQLPGGNVKRKESSEDAIRREILEELKIKLPNVEKVGSLVQKVEHRMAHTDYFLTRVPSKDFNIDNVEIKEARWFPFKEYSETHADICAMVHML